MQPDSLLPAVVDIARAAGADILTVYAGDFAVRQKADASPVTAADMAAHERIIAALTELTPTIPVLSEEAADEVAFDTRTAWNPYWLVDPLDGTKEFVGRNGQFTVNIALIRDHSPVLGVVHVPVTGITYFADSGRGAWRQTGDQPAQPIRVCSTRRIPRVVGSRSHLDPTVARYLDNLGEHEWQAIGSSLKFCLVAEGSADVYPRFGPTSEWDIAAAHAIVNEAGGRVVTPDGEPMRYNTGESLLNSHFIVLGNPTRDWLKYVPQD